MNAPIELRVIPGYQGRYAAGADGQIWSLPKTWVSGNGTTRSRDGGPLRPDIGKHGYHRVTLLKDGKRERFLVHRLVALAWLPNPGSRPFVNHLNGNKGDNRPTNLEWCTQGENERHAWRNGLKADSPERREIRRQTMRRVNDDMRARRAQREGGAQ